jgi:hypothetical protein
MILGDDIHADIVVIPGVLYRFVIWESGAPRAAAGQPADRRNGAYVQ